MTTFDKREQGFEYEFIHDKELKFKATVRRDRMLGDWAAGQLGLTGEAAATYANELVTADVANHDDSLSCAGFRRTSEKGDFAARGRNEDESVLPRRPRAN